MKDPTHYQGYIITKIQPILAQSILGWGFKWKNNELFYFSSPNQRYDIIICVYWFELFSQVSDVAHGPLVYFIRPSWFFKVSEAIENLVFYCVYCKGQRNAALLYDILCYFTMEYEKWYTSLLLTQCEENLSITCRFHVSAVVLPVYISY